MGVCVFVGVDIEKGVLVEDTTVDDTPGVNCEGILMHAVSTMLHSVTKINKIVTLDHRDNMNYHPTLREVKR